MSNGKSYYVDLDQWLELIADTSPEEWDTYRDKALEVDRILQRSVQRTEKLAKYLPGFTPLQYTSQNKEWKKIFRDVRTLYDYVKGLPEAIKNYIDKRFYKAVNTATHELSAIRKEDFKTTNTLGVVHNLPKEGAVGIA